MKDDGLLPLPMLREGSKGKVVAVHGGNKASLRLIEMGFNPGTCVRLIKSAHRGPLIVAIDDTRFAIGKGMAMKIMVKEVK